MNRLESRLEELGEKLPSVPPAAGNFLPAVVHDNLLFCSGQGAFVNGSQKYVGRVGSEVSLEEAYEAARIASLNCLAAAASAAGSLERIVRIIQVRGFVNSADDFHDQPKVVNGASDFLVELFGDAGRHARCALGTSNLPGNIPVELEMVVEIE